jgi:hypothetical protein
MGRGPEEDGTSRIESQAHQHCDFVALTLQDLGGDRREAEITNTKVNDLGC